MTSLGSLEFGEYSEFTGDFGGGGGGIVTSFVSLTLGGGYSNFTGVLGLLWCSWRWRGGDRWGGGGL